MNQRARAPAIETPDDSTCLQMRLPSRRIALLLSGLAASALLTAWVLSWPSEPKADGKRLSQWLRAYSTSQPGDERDQAVAAVRAIGTNAVPFLLGWVRYTGNGSNQHPPNSLVGKLRNALSTLYVPAETRHSLARNGFEILGPAASQALPDLMDLATNSPPVPSETAIISLSYLGVEARPALPALLFCLQHTNELIGAAAASALGRLKLDPASAVPALTAAILSPSPKVSLASADALGKFGDQARTALPALVSLLDGPSQNARIAAQLAIEGIDPSVLTKEQRQSTAQAQSLFRKRYFKSAAPNR